MITSKMKFIPQVDLEIATTKGVTPRAHRASLMFTRDPEKAPEEAIMVVFNPRIYSCQNLAQNLKVYFCCRVPVSLRKM